jgi:NTE family protein
MIAFVMSGGGNRGAAQAGALRALLERGIQPDLLVGTSVGSLSAVLLASEPTIDGAHRLVATWRGVKRAHIFPGNPLTAGWRLLTRQGSLHSRHNFTRFLRASLPSEFQRFGDLRQPAYVTATVLGAARMRVFGEQPDDPLLDGLLASTAIPPFFPPYRYGDEWLVDGAVLANLPLAVATRHGAREIFALQIVNGEATASGRSLAQTLGYSLSAILSRQDELEHRLTSLERQRRVVHLIRLSAGQELAYNDFDHTDDLIEAGYRAAIAYLDAMPDQATARRRRVAATVRAALRLRWPRAARGAGA